MAENLPVAILETAPSLRILRDVASRGTLTAPRIDAAGVTDIGLARRTNQDQYLIAELRRELDIVDAGPAVAPRAIERAQGKLLAVADGMGGHGGGDIASAIVLDSLARYVASTLPWYSAKTPPSTEALKAEFKRATMHCLKKLLQAAEQEGITDQNPGTTLTAACIVWPNLFLLHVGDSRAYLYRNGRLRCLTRDHTVAQELAETEEGRGMNVSRSPFSHILTNAVGGGLSEPRPDAARIEVDYGDLLLLCSDGLSNQVSDARIHEELENGGETADICQRLVGQAIRSGGSDNITAVVARFV